MARVKYTKEEIKQKRKEQRQKAALKSYRCRGLKNFFIWLTGFLTSIVFLVSALFVGLKVVPIKTYLGNSSNEMLSEEVSSKSIIDALLNASKYDMNDFPVVVDAVDEILDSIGVDGFIEIDKDKVKSLDFNDDFTSGLLSCIKIAEGGAQKLLGDDLGKLDVFQNKWDIIPAESEDQPQTGTDGNILKTDKGELLSNPKLYYFQKPVDGGTSPLAKTYSESYEWVRAFDDEGHPINGYTDDQTLYYANLNAVPIVDVLDLIDESLGRVSITSILGVVGLGGSSGGSSGEGTEGGSGDSGDTAGDLINKIFDGVNIQDVGKKPMGELFSNLLISDLGLGEDVAKIIGSIVVDENNNPIPFESVSIGHLMSGKFNVNGLKLGELLNGNTEILDLLSSVVVDADGNPVPSNEITIGHLLGADEDVKLNVNNLKLAELLKDNDEILDLLSSVVVDKEGNSVAKEDITIGHLLGVDENAKLNVNNLKLGELLKDNDEILDLLSSIVVDTDGNPVPSSDITIGHLLGANENAKLNVNNLKLADLLKGNDDILDLLSSVVVDKDGNSVAKEDITIGHLMGTDEDAKLNINNLKLADYLDSDTLELLASIILDENNNPIPAGDITIGHLTADNMDFNGIKLNNFLDEGILETLSSIILDEDGNSILPNDLTIAHLSGSNFELNNLKLDKFLDADTLELLSLMIVDEDGNAILAKNLTIAHIKSANMNFDGIKLDKFLGDYSDNKEMYDMLHSIIKWEAGATVPTADKLTVGDLAQGINFNQMSLQKFLGDYNDNKDMYDILHSIIDWKDGATISSAGNLTVGDLSNGINFNKLSLEQVLGDYDDNKITYDVLCSAVGLGSGQQNYSKLTIEHLKEGIDFDKVSLQVLGLDDGTLNMLLNAANASRKQGDPEIAKGELTIKHISSDIFSYIRLTDVMPFNAGANGNAQLYSILLQASSVTLIDPTDNNEISQKAQTLNISSLSNFKIELVKLNTILPISENAKLYDILADVTGEDKGNIKISDFASFDPTKIHLSTVMQSSENVILKKLIESGATIGNLGDAINELSLYDIYGQNCFKERKGADAGNQPTYNKVVSGKYVRYDLDKTGNGEYIISDEAGVWLILCFKPTEGSGVVKDTKSKYYGCRESYTATTANMESLQNGTNIAGTIGGATIRELVIIGLIEDSATLTAAYAGTLQEALALIKFGK